MLEDYLDGILADLRTLLLAKNKAYGDQNLVEDGMPGIIVRVKDKLNRIKNLDEMRRIGSEDHKIQESTRESIEDTLLDIAGYAVNALRLRKEDLI